MATCEDFLFELGTAELPARGLLIWAQTLAHQIAQQLQQAGFSHGKVQYFATPRRLAVLIENLGAQQPARTIERKGPALTAAFGSDGQPTPAALGFARSCGTTVDQLHQETTSAGAWLVFRSEQPGQSVVAMLPEVMQKALTALPIKNPMRWGEHTAPFIRPVRWIVMLYGQAVVPATLFGAVAGRTTYGHRFHAPAALEIRCPSEYSDLLHQQAVIADFATRRAVIAAEVMRLAAAQAGEAAIDEELLDEVTGLVEWPVAVLGNFSAKFLTLPPEVIIAVLKNQQKYFHLVDQNGALLPAFITISNINSKDPMVVKTGNERVIAARLSDALFFYEQDQHKRLIDRVADLKQVIFQAKLGTLYDKSQRIAAIAEAICNELKPGEGALAQRAGLLCKTDLLTEMVKEFPELQGTIGYYYADKQQEDTQVVKALRDHYYPRFAGDSLPTEPVSIAVALADRVDTLFGIFHVQGGPTGEKDPFSLRRAAIGVIRIIIENNLTLSWHGLKKLVVNAYGLTEATAAASAAAVHHFILGRLPSWYAEQNIATDTVEAVLSVSNNASLLAIDRRIKALQQFRQQPEAQALAAANKRAKNILLKEKNLEHIEFNVNALCEPAEQALYAAMQHWQSQQPNLLNTIGQEQVLALGEYEQALAGLSALKGSIDDFFNTVRVDTPEPELRYNRLALLQKLRQLFLTIADISVLQVTPL